MQFFRKINSNLTPLISFIAIIRLIIPNKSKKLIFFSILLIINGVTELLSLVTLMPFLSILSNPEATPESTLFNTITNFFQIESGQIIPFSTIIFISIVLFSLFIRLFTYRYGLKLTAELGTFLSTKIFSTIIYQPYKLLIQKNTGELIYTLTKELEQIINLLMLFFKMITALVSFIFIFSGLVFINIYVALLCIISLTLAYLVLSNKSSIVLKKNSFIFTDTNNRIVKHIQETLGSIRDIVIDNNHKYYINNYWNLQNKLRNSVTEVNLISFTPSYVLESLALITLALLGFLLIFIWKISECYFDSWYCSSWLNKIIKSKSTNLCCFYASKSKK